MGAVHKVYDPEGTTAGRAKVREISNIIWKKVKVTGHPSALDFNDHKDTKHEHVFQLLKDLDV